MIRVRVDLVPFGNEDEAKQIAEMVIAHIDGLDHNTRYFSAISTDAHQPIFKTAYHDRREGLWTLIKHVISSIEYGIDKKYESILADKIELLKEK